MRAREFKENKMEHEVYKMLRNEHTRVLISYDFTFFKRGMAKACFRVVRCVEECQGVLESANAW